MKKIIKRTKYLSIYSKGKTIIIPIINNLKWLHK